MFKSAIANRPPNVYNLKSKDSLAWAKLISFNPFLMEIIDEQKEKKAAAAAPV